MRALPLALAGVFLVTALPAPGAAAGPHKHAPHPKPPPVGQEPDAPPPAPATPPGDTYAIVIDIAGDADPGVRTAIAGAIARGLDQAGAVHVTPDVVAQALRAHPELVGCTSTTCLGTLGGIVGAARFLTAHVETAGAAYTIELTVLTSDGTVGHRRAACEVCTMSDLADLLTKKSAELIAHPQPEPLAVTIASAPIGARISLGDAGQQGPLRALGPSPANVQLAPGTYVVEADLAGFTELRQTITVADTGEPQTFHLALTAEQAPIVETTPRFHRWKWIAAGGGAALIVTGAIVLSFDGGNTCGTPPCRQVYESTPQGIALIVVGVAAGAASGWMFWRDAHDHASATAAVAPTRGGAFALVTVSF